MKISVALMEIAQMCTAVKVNKSHQTVPLENGDITRWSAIYKDTTCWTPTEKPLAECSWDSWWPLNYHCSRWITFTVLLKQPTVQAPSKCFISQWMNHLTLHLYIIGHSHHYFLGFHYVSTQQMQYSLPFPEHTFTVLCSQLFPRSNSIWSSYSYPWWYYLLAKNCDPKSSQAVFIYTPPSSV